MRLRHDTKWSDVVGREVWAKYAHNPVMVTFRVLSCDDYRMWIDHRPVWTDSVPVGDGVWEVEQDAFRMLDV